MLENKKHGKSIDWYGIGAVLYEFLCGVPPYFTQDPDKLYENIKSGPLKMPNNRFSKECSHLLTKLLIRNPLERLGARDGFEEVKRHTWFQDVNWDHVYEKKVYCFVYKTKQLKNRVNRINIDDM